VDENTGAVVDVMLGTRMDSSIEGVRGGGVPAETIFGGEGARAGSKFLRVIHELGDSDVQSAVGNPFRLLGARGRPMTPVTSYSLSPSKLSTATRGYRWHL